METFIFSWDPVTTFSDGSPIVNLSGYKLYLSTTAGVRGALLRTFTPAETSYAYSTSSPGLKYCVLTAYTPTQESDPTLEVSFQIGQKKPSVPGNFVVN